MGGMETLLSVYENTPLKASVYVEPKAFHVLRCDIFHAFPRLRNFMGWGGFLIRPSVLLRGQLEAFAVGAFEVRVREVGAFAGELFGFRVEGEVLAEG